MLEGLAAKILQNYIGKYVKVNADKLSVGLLSGVVELDNLPLIPEAFNDHDLPFELKFGFLKKIKLNISLNSLRYTPLVLTADNLFIIIAPKESKEKDSTSTADNDNEIISDQIVKQENTSDEKNDLNEIQNSKLDSLNNLENKWFKEVEYLGK